MYILGIYGDIKQHSILKQWGFLTVSLGQISQEPLSCISGYMSLIPGLLWSWSQNASPGCGLVWGVPLADEPILGLLPWLLAGLGTMLALVSVSHHKNFSTGELFSLRVRVSKRNRNWLSWELSWGGQSIHLPYFVCKGWITTSSPNLREPIIQGTNQR